MKKIILPLLAIVLLTGKISAQTGKNTTQNEDVLKKGDNVVNLYYGVSIVGSIYKSAASQNAVDLKVKTLGPVGLVYEHMVTKNLGLGAEFGYTRFILTYTEPGYFVNSTEPFKAELTFQVIRVMFRANFHFLNTENFNAYAFVSGGYKGSTYEYKSNDPLDQGTATFRSVLPFGVKPGVGLRYFFIPDLGLNLEFAIGTPIMGGGLTFKF